MFIKNLKIKKGTEIIRDINFKEGINLILDETNTKDLKESGNNIGKTTLLRLIDYCLGSSGKNIYKDQEFKDKSNLNIENFLKEKEILVSLTLVNHLNDLGSPSILIERNFLEDDKKICRINGEDYSNLKEQFLPKLKELIFKSKNKKPTFRQIISRNVRDEKDKLINVLRVLYPTTKQEEYESLYLFWLGIEDESMSEKQELQRKKLIEEKIQSRLKKEGSYSQVKQSLIVIEKNILELEKSRDLLSENPNYEKDLTSLQKIRFEISRLSTKANQLDLRRDLIIESKEDLESQISEIDTNKIKQLYLEAKSFIPDIQKSFEETLEFHNQMINEKVAYITQELPSLESEINNTKKEISLLLSKEKDLLIKIKKSDMIENLEEIIKQLTSFYEDKGKFEEKKRIWESSQEELKSINSKLNKINGLLEKKEKLIDERITKFNDYFSNISDKLYGERFILSLDKNKKGYELKITSIAGNLGTGKKKVLIVAFDFAYIKFADSIGIDCLHFILHDQIENIHNNQITSILTEVIKEVNCQYIIPALKDKLPQELDIDSMKIITLSQKDKLFRVP